MGPAFELDAVEKAYAHLGPIDMIVPVGKTTMLIGPSGCGKSTLLRVLIGLVRPDRGAVRFQGKPLLFEDRLRMGYGIQDGGLFPHLTAEENVTIMARHLGRDPAEIAARRDDLVALTHLPGDALRRYPAELSGGQRQRVSLMRALMLDPEVLLLDEPLGALDPMIRADLQADLRGIFHELKKTVVFVTHDLGEAAFLGDRIVLLRGGKIVQIGTLRELADTPADPFVSKFVSAQRGFAA